MDRGYKASRLLSYWDLSEICLEFIRSSLGIRREFVGDSSRVRQGFVGR